MGIVSGVACVACGVYMGKLRAQGKSWGQIGRMIFDGAQHAISNVYRTTKKVFKRDDASVVDIDGEMRDAEQN